MQCAHLLAACPNPRQVSLAACAKGDANKTEGWGLQPFLNEHGLSQVKNESWLSFFISANPFRNCIESQEMKLNYYNYCIVFLNEIALPCNHHANNSTRDRCKAEQ